MSDPTRDGVATQPGINPDNNRGHDNVVRGDIPPVEVTLEKINEIILSYMRDAIAPAILDNGVARIVPIVYGTKERWATVRKDGALRDETGKQQLPVIFIRRTSEKVSDRIANPMNKYLFRTVTTGWNERNSYDKFAVQNNIRPPEKTVQVMVPDYMDLTYEVIMWTEYQEQMDRLVELLAMENQDYWGDRNNYKFMVNIDEFTGESELPAAEDRVIRSHFTLTVQGYLLSESYINEYKRSASSILQYSKKKIVAFTETVISLKK